VAFGHIIPSCWYVLKPIEHTSTNGVFVFSQEVFQREVLIKLLEQQRYLPTFFADKSSLPISQVTIAGD